MCYQSHRSTQTWGALDSNGSGAGALNGWGWVEALAVALDGKVYVGGYFSPGNTVTIRWPIMWPRIGL
ncbi:hypothetical protein [Chloroflexus sp.]|uniref:hypothetical protein n=1 Tax=Chloroflexus sp. TaxID=1904827 RepID=UPI002ACE7244|nr:hypothetical protein [Chloroflexus sp.]